MNISAFQYKLLGQIAYVGTARSSELAKTLNTTIFRVSKNLRKLKEQNLIFKTGNSVTISDSGLAPVLGRFLLDHPGVGESLSDRGLTILQLFEKPQTLNAIMESTHLTKRSAYRYLHDFLNIGILKRNDGLYNPNFEIWPDLLELIVLTKYKSKASKKEIPPTAKIYLEEPERVIFSTELPISAAPTAFSEYNQFGIPIIEEEKIYRLPKKKLTIKEIFLDSLECLTNIRRKIITVLFYKKYEQFLNKIKHPELEKIRGLLNGEHIPGYPSIEEVKERAELYDIKI